MTRLHTRSSQTPFMAHSIAFLLYWLSVRITFFVSRNPRRLKTEQSLPVSLRSLSRELSTGQAETGAYCGRAIAASAIWLPLH